MSSFMTETIEPNSVPKDWMPLLLWPKYFYKQQKEFIHSPSWQAWFIGGNGTGKTHILYWSLAALALGVHPLQPAPPPIKLRVLVPSFDSVEDVALDKLLENQMVVYIDEEGKTQNFEIGPMLPKSMISTKGFYTRDHRKLNLRNGSSIAWVTTEQGWRFMRGSQFDILAMDEESDERVFDENLRGLRNAKGGGRVLGALTPPYEEGQGPTWTKARIVDNSLDDPDISVFSACMADNPAITDQFIKRFSRGKTQRQIDVQVFGKYPVWGDVIYPSYQDRLWDETTQTGSLLPWDLDIPKAREVDWVMSFDWHQSKPCAGVWGWVDRDENIIFYEELDKEAVRGKTIRELSEDYRNIEGYPYDGRKFRRWQDPSAKHKYNAQIKGFNAWDEFARNGIITKEAKNKDPETGISILNDYLEGDMVTQPRVFFRETMKYTRQGFLNHYWKRDKDLTVAKPDAKWGDYPITIRYIVQEVGARRRKKNKWPLYTFGDRKTGPKRFNLNF